MSKKTLPYVVERAINLKADPKKVLEFHLHPKNLSRVNPAGIRILSLEAPETITAGSHLRLKVSSWGIPQTWAVVVREVSDFSGSPAKASILDEAVQGPFPFWRHLHEFWAAPDGTTGLVDRVEFLPPGGPAGKLLLPIFRWFLNKMFQSRQETTRLIFEEQKA
jgi:ligand-binding SRPBCC domain-containing protein